MSHYWQWYTASMPTVSYPAKEPLLASLNWLESMLQWWNAKNWAGLKLQTIDSISASSPSQHSQTTSFFTEVMFYWNQGELLSVVSHRCRKMAAWCWAVTPVKRQNEGSDCMAAWPLSQAWKVHFFTTFSDEGWAARWWWPQGQPLVNSTSPASHTYWTVALSPSPSESQWSRLTGLPPGYQESATGATGYLWVCLLSITSGLVCVSILKYFKVEKKPEEMWNEHWYDKVTFASFRCPTEH